MQILLDPQIFHIQKFGGISRLFVALLDHFNQLGDVEVNCPIIYSENLHLEDAGLNPKNVWSILRHLDFPGPRRLKEMIKQKGLKATSRALKRGNHDVFISTYFNPYFIPGLGATPFILTIYDMIHEIYPQYFVNDRTTAANKKLMIEKANRVVAISNQTREDIIKFYPHIDAEKIDVIYLAQSIVQNAPGVAGLPQKFILFVGNRPKYKNFDFFVKAIAPLLRTDSSLHLVCAGGGNFDTSEQELISELGIGNKVIQRNYKDHELGEYYRAATLFVFPSLYEGFGIPTLEAMSCGCPVILANSSCLKEIGGNAALYFEPNDAQSLLMQIQSLIENETLRKELISKGYEREKEFTWKKTASGYLETIRKALK